MVRWKKNPTAPYEISARVWEKRDSYPTGMLRNRWAQNDRARLVAHAVILYPRFVILLSSFRKKLEVMLQKQTNNLG